MAAPTYHDRRISFYQTQLGVVAEATVASAPGRSGPRQSVTSCGTASSSGLVFIFTERFDLDMLRTCWRQL
jgi:hypothetical protein